MHLFWKIWWKSAEAGASKFILFIFPFAILRHPVALFGMCCRRLLHARILIKHGRKRNIAGGLFMEEFYPFPLWYFFNCIHPSRMYTFFWIFMSRSLCLEEKQWSLKKPPSDYRFPFWRDSLEVQLEWKTSGFKNKKEKIRKSCI